MLLSEDEKDALGAALALPNEDARARALARPHQLIQPGADGKAALELADRVGSAAAKAVCIALIGETRAAWDVQVATAELVAQPAARIAAAGLALAVGTAQGPGALLLGPGLAQALVRAVLGVSSDGGDVAPAAPLGVADRPVVARLLAVFTREMGARIAAEGGAELHAGQLVDDPTRLCALRGPLLSMPLRFAAPIEGTLELLLPLQVAGVVPQALGRARVADHVPQLELEVVAELGRARIRLSELSQLTPGMELALDSHESALLPVLVGGTARFFGRPMASEGKLAVQIALKEPKAAPMRAPKDTAARPGQLG